MWFVPLLLVGALIIGAVTRPKSELVPALPRQAAFPPPPPPSPPGPISVLGEFVRVGQTPPPTVILCAIAEAETIGRNDLASDIVKVFVAPVVYQHELAKARRAPTMPVVYGPPSAFAPACAPAYERGSCALPLAQRSPREQVFHAPPPAAVPAPMPAPVAVPMPHGARLATDEEIRAMLNADPQKFIEMATRGMPVVEVPVEAVQRAAQPLVSPPPMTAPSMPTPPSPASSIPTGLPPEAVAQMQEAAGLHGAADQTRAMAPGSPIVGVPDGAWREFAMRLERESPLFSSSRHVGQYRQRRERLVELGIDPDAIHGSAQAQRAALDADLADAHHHAAESGLLGEHLGRPIAVPGRDGSEPITLSGLLGVIQCAGLEGAVGWLERPNDRKRYPHTTQAYLRANGVF